MYVALYGQPDRRDAETFRRDRSPISPASRAKRTAFATGSFEEEKRRIIEAARDPELRAELAHQIRCNATARLLNDLETMLIVVSTNGMLLEYCSEFLRRNAEVVLAAIKQSPDASKYAIGTWTCTRAQALEAVKINGRFLGRIDEDFGADREVVLAAVQNNGLALGWASRELQGDKDLVMQAMQNDPRALRFASDSLTADREIVKEALKGPGYQYIAESLRFNRDIVVLALRVAKRLGEDVLMIMLRTSEELHSDQDLLLFAARCAKDKVTRQQLYREAPSAMKSKMRMKAFLDAVPTAIAAKGEVAPVLTVHLTVADGSPSEKRSFCADVSLLSGATFTCEFVESDRNPANLASLARVLVEHLAKNTEVSDAEHVYISFVKDNGDHIAVSAWDWSLPLSEFL